MELALDGILETSLYVRDLSRSVTFYRSLFGVDVLMADERFCALNVGDRQVLLLFLQGASSKASETPGGVIPAHDGQGQLHVAFAIPVGSLEQWERRLESLGVSVESRVNWPRGGTSLYFRDPDDHTIELATPGLWAND